MNYLRRRPYKLFYIPGVISAVLLLLVSAVYFWQLESLKPKRVIQVTAWDPVFDNPPNIIWKLHPERYFDTVIINGNSAETQVQLAYTKLLLKEIISKPDTVRGIHVLFGDDTKFGDLIATLDIAAQLKFKTYSFYKGNLWFFYIDMHRKELEVKKDQANIIVPMFACGCCPLPPKVTLKENLLVSFKKYAFPYWPIWTGFTILSLISLRKILKRGE